MKSILLSICLATYNQPDKVKRFFDNLAPQLNSNNGQQIEIVVRDDSVDFATEMLIKNYSEKILAPIRYFKGKKEGLDVAINFLTQEAIGRYIWWFGDDFLDQGAIDYILNIIKSNQDISLIYINSRGIDNELSFHISSDKFFKDKNQVIEEIADNLGYITATIIKKEDVLPFIELSEKYIGTAWVNLYLVLSVIGNGRRFYFVSYPYIIGDPKLSDQPAWYDGFWVFAINFWQIIDAVKKNFTKKSIERVLNNNAWKISKGILVYRVKGYKIGLGSSRASFKTLFPFYWRYSKFWLATPFLLMPNFVLRFLYKIYKKI